MVSADHGASGAPIPTDPIRLYLAQLEAAMAGQDPALVHDALVDAESHLRAALAAGASPDRAIAEFGTPDEIARAYVDAERQPRVWTMAPSAALLGAGSASGAGGATAATATATDSADPTTARAAAGAPNASAARPGAGTAPFGRADGVPVLVPAQPVLERLAAVPVFGIWFNRYAWGGLFYFGAVGFLLSLAYFIWVITLGSVALGTMPILIGFVLLVVLLGSVRAICLFEGMVVELFLGVRMPRRTQPVYTDAGIGFWQRIGCWLRDLRSWLSLAYLLGGFPVSAILFAIFIGLTAASGILVGSLFGALLGFPVAQVHTDSDFSYHFLWYRLRPDASGDVHLPISAALASAAIGILLFTLTLWIARGTGWVYGHVVQMIQVARPRAVLLPRTPAAPGGPGASAPQHRPGAEPPLAR
ncbi:MAG: sensor domain-containing protein [Phycisphaerales bacterium]